MECQFQIKCFRSKNIKESVAWDAKYSLTTLHRKLQELISGINIFSNEPPLPLEKKVQGIVECGGNEPCMYEPKKKYSTDACAENITLGDSFLFGSDLDKYTKNLSFFGPYNNQTNLLHKYRAHAVSNEKCSKEDPCTACLIAAIKNLVKKKTESINKQSKHLDCSSQKLDRKKQCECNFGYDFEWNKKQNNMGASKSNTKLFDFCPEQDISDCCFQCKKRLWFTGKGAPVIAKTKEQKTRKLENKVKKLHVHFNTSTKEK